MKHEPRKQRRDEQVHRRQCPLEQDSAEHVHAHAEGEVDRRDMRLVYVERRLDVRLKAADEIQDRNPQQLGGARANGIDQHRRSTVDFPEPQGEAGARRLLGHAVQHREQIFPRVVEDEGVPGPDEQSDPDDDSGRADRCAPPST